MSSIRRRKSTLVSFVFCKLSLKILCSSLCQEKFYLQEHIVDVVYMLCFRSDPLLIWTVVIPGSLCSIQAVYTLSRSRLSSRGGGGQFS